jgi:hypothetical protein
MLVLIIVLSICGVGTAETIRATVNGVVCGFCATGIEKLSKLNRKSKPSTSI